MNRSANRDRSGDGEPAGHLPRTVGAGTLEPAFEQAEHCIGRQRQQRRGNGSGENQAIIHRGDAAKDQLAESACAHGRGNGRNADAGDGRGSETGENEGCRERQLNLEETLRIGESQWRAQLR